MSKQKDLYIFLVIVDGKTKFTLSDNAIGRKEVKRLQGLKGIDIVKKRVETH